MVEATREDAENRAPLQDVRDVYDQFRGTSGETAEVASVLLENDEAINLERSQIFLALELSRMDLELSEQDRTALLFLVLASMIAKQRGSVRFDLGTRGDSEQSLSNRLERKLSGIQDVLSTQDNLQFEWLSGENTIWDELASTIEDVIDNLEDAAIIGREEDQKPLIVRDGHLYHQRSHAQENRLASYLRERIFYDRPDQIPLEFLPDSDDLEDSLWQVCKVSAFELTAKQQYGILTAACAPLSVITGGPGTGKTSIVLSLVRFLVELGIEPDEIALAAPTGKAANRLGESLTQGLDPEGHTVDRKIAEEFESPSTLHRLLGYSPEFENFYHHENRPLPHRYIIVDEASMIDLSLMEQLLSAVADSSSLCLLGDADQLPAVESGAVFRDLIPERQNSDVPWRELASDPLDFERAQTSAEPLARQAIRLDENFRVRGGDPSTVNLVQVAREINEGGEDLTFTKPGDVSSDAVRIMKRENFQDLKFSGVEFLPLAEVQTGQSSEEVKIGRSFTRLLHNWYDRWLESQLFDVLPGNRSIVTKEFSFRQGRPDDCQEELDRIFRTSNEAQLLSVTRRTPLGVRTINQILHGYHRRTSELIGTSSRADFLPGEPIIMMQNDYDRQLFNGEQGLILLVNQPTMEQPKPMAVFPDLEGYRSFHLGPLRSELNHAFALTVHKAQGSEYGSVGIILPSREVPLMTRELLYTAVTRARESVTFFGDQEMIRKGVKKQDERNSGLLERLK